jgi:hypothetical protein
LIFQQELAETSHIALNHYNETNHFKWTSEKVSSINLAHDFLGEIKYHWDSFSVFEMLQEKLHRVVVNNVDAKVKVRWLKLWKENKFDKDDLYFLKTSLSDSTFDDWSSKSIYWAQLEKKLLKSFRVFFYIIFNCLQMCLLSPSIFKPRSLWLSIQYFIMNSKAKKSKNITLGMSNLI